MKFRKKPVVIEAEQFLPPVRPLPADMKELMGVEVPGYPGAPDDAVTVIETLEGPHIVSPGDWIITGVKGERYPCKPDIFEATYDPAE